MLLRASSFVAENLRQSSSVQGENSSSLVFQKSNSSMKDPFDDTEDCVPDEHEEGIAINMSA